MNALQFKKNLLGMQENMMNFALMLTANREDAQDLMQDTTLKVLDNQEKFIDNVNFKGWVLTIMRNIFINNYQIQEISKAIENLNKDLKFPFSMYVSGYKYNEIAEKLGLPLGTVKSRIFFARQELQKTLKDYR